MRVLVACDDFFPDRPSGAARVAWDIAQFIRSTGNHVSYVAVNQHPDRQSDGPDCVDGVEVLRYTPEPCSALDPRRFQRRAASAAEATARSFAHVKPDVLHIHSPMTGSGVLSAISKPARIVYTAHSPIVLEQKINWAQQGWAGRVKSLLGTRFLRKLELSLFERADAIHVLSQWMQRQIQDEYKLGAKVVVLPHWCRPGFGGLADKGAARRELNWPADVPTFFTVRRHVHRMGLDIAIEAIAPLAAAGKCRFVIAGDGPLRPSLQEQASKAGCGTTQISFVGKLSDQDLRLSYQAADLFLLPTRALEGFGLIIVESLSCGCPVMGTDVGAIPEIVAPISPDLVVPPGRADLLREALQKFLDSHIKLPSPQQLLNYIERRNGLEHLGAGYRSLFGI